MTKQGGKFMQTYSFTTWNGSLLARAMAGLRLTGGSKALDCWESSPLPSSFFCSACFFSKNLFGFFEFEIWIRPANRLAKNLKKRLKPNLCRKFAFAQWTSTVDSCCFSTLWETNFKRRLRPHGIAEGKLTVSDNPSSFEPQWDLCSSGDNPNKYIQQPWLVCDSCWH